MATAKLQSLRGEKSALIGVKPNAFEFGYSFAYVPREAIKQVLGQAKFDKLEEDKNYWEDDINFEIPDGFVLADMINEDGEVRTTKDGEPLKVLKY